MLNLKILNVKIIVFSIKFSSFNITGEALKSAQTLRYFCNNIYTILVKIFPSLCSKFSSLQEYKLIFTYLNL